MKNVLEHLSGLNLAVEYVDCLDTVETLAQRQAEFNRAVIRVLVESGLVAPNAGWELQEKN